MDTGNIMLNEISQIQKEIFFYDSTYLMYLEQANSQRQKEKPMLPGSRGRRRLEVTVKCTEFLLGMMKMV